MDSNAAPQVRKRVPVEPDFGSAREVPLWIAKANVRQNRVAVDRPFDFSDADVETVFKFKRRNLPCHKVTTRLAIKPEIASGRYRH